MSGKQLMRNLGQDLLMKCLGEAPLFNVSAVARAFGANKSRVWHYIKGRNKWPADDWLKVMIVLGRVHEGRDAFEIRVPKTSAMCKTFDALKRVDYLRYAHGKEDEPQDNGRDAPVRDATLPPAWDGE